jgi:ABC-type microcin C transport system duplicated ATPase subunit YejF
VLADGVLVEHGPARDVLTKPTHAATKALLEA